MFRGRRLLPGEGRGVVALSVELVAQLWSETRFTDGPLDAFGIESVAGAAEETTFSSIIIEPKSLAPQCRAICAVALPTVSHEACMLRMLWSTMRLTAMRRRYSSGEKRERTPSFSSRVPSLQNIHGMKAMKP